MRYVERDAQGKIIGSFACEQSPKQEVLPDDHPELVAFQAVRAAQNDAALAEMASFKDRIAALESQVAQLTQPKRV